MEHFVALSNLNSKLKRRITSDKFFMHETVPKLLHKDGQELENFDVASFAKQHNLLTFSFVRHPFERFGIHKSLCAKVQKKC